MPKSLIKCMLYRNTINNSPIQHRDTIHIHDFAHKRQTARSSYNIKRTLTFLISLRKIHRLPREAIGGYHLKSIGIFKISIKIKRKQLVRKLVVKQLTIKYAALSNKMTDTYILITCQVINIRNTSTTRLPTHIRHAITSTCRNSYHIGEVQIVLHKSIQYTAGENASHSTTFQH